MKKDEKNVRKRPVYSSFGYDDIPKELVSSEDSALDNVPVKTRKEYFLEFMSNGELAEARMRKLYFGEEIPTADKMEYVDLYSQYMEDKLARYREQNNADIVDKVDNPPAEAQSGDNSGNNAKGSTT